MTEVEKVQDLFVQILCRLATPDGMDAVGLELPKFIASLLIGGRDPEGGLDALVESVRACVNLCRNIETLVDLPTTRPN